MIGRLTLCIPSLEGGGAARSALRLTEALIERGHAVSVLTTDESADFYDVPDSVRRVAASKEASLSCRWFDIRCQWVRLRALRRSVLATHPDLVISFLDTMNVSVLIALLGQSVPVIVSERTDPREHRIGARWNLLRRLAYWRAARVIVLTEAVAAWSRRLWPRWNVDVIPNAVVSYASEKSAPKGRSDRRTVAGLGRLSREKGFDQLIQAFAMVASALPDWDLAIFGDGPERERLVRLAQELSISDRLQMHGAVKDPHTALTSCDLFVLSSRYEGFPNALAEAMSLGLPVISFDCQSGPREIIRDGIDGVLVPNQDIGALAAAMRQLMTNPSDRSRLALRASEIVQRFAPERIFERWHAMISTILDKGA